MSGDNAYVDISSTSWADVRDEEEDVQTTPKTTKSWEATDKLDRKDNEVWENAQKQGSSHQPRQTASYSNGKYQSSDRPYYARDEQKREYKRDDYKRDDYKRDDYKRDEYKRNDREFKPRSEWGSDKSKTSYGGSQKRGGESEKEERKYTPREVPETGPYKIGFILFGMKGLALNMPEVFEVCKFDTSKIVEGSQKELEANVGVVEVTDRDYVVSLFQKEPRFNYMAGTVKIVLDPHESRQKKTFGERKDKPFNKYGDKQGDKLGKQGDAFGKKQTHTNQKKDGNGDIWTMKGQAPQQTKKATKTETVTPTKAAPKKMGFDILGDE